MNLIEKKGFTVIGLPVRAGWQELWHEMPKAWNAFMKRYIEIEHRRNDTFLDVSLDKVDNEYLQLICAQVSRVGVVPDGMKAFEIPAQQYIHFRHTGTVEEIAASFGNMYEWARMHGVPAGEFKVDVGYTSADDEHGHDLFVGLLPETPWRELY